MAGLPPGQTTSSVESYVHQLISPDTRENALLELSKKRENFPELAPYLWYSFGTIAALLQEIISIYPLLSPPSLTAHASNRVCNALALLQCVASHQDTRSMFLQGARRLAAFAHARLTSFPAVQHTRPPPLAALQVIYLSSCTPSSAHPARHGRLSTCGLRASASLARLSRSDARPALQRNDRSQSARGIAMLATARACLAQRVSIQTRGHVCSAPGPALQRSQATHSNELFSLCRSTTRMSSTSCCQRRSSLCACGPWRSAASSPRQWPHSSCRRSF